MLDIRLPYGYFALQQILQCSNSQISVVIGAKLMENNPFGQFDTVSKAAADSAKELESINTKLLEKLTQKNMDLFNSTVDLNNKFISLFGNAKGVQELIAEQTQLSAEYNAKLMATMQEAGEIVMGSQGGYQSWIESGFKSFIPATPKATRKKAA